MKKLAIVVLALSSVISTTVSANYKEYVKAQLNDPESAQFKDVGIYNGGGTEIYCGYVNAKNGFGGYIGWTPFFSKTKELTIIRGDSRLASGAFEETWNKMCRNRIH